MRLCSMKILYCMLIVFFFSSRRRHTRLQGDWSSDVCSSDLLVGIDRAPSCEGTWAELAWDWDAPAEAWHVAERGDLAAPHDAATRHVHTAARVYESAHDVPAARAAIERAVAADPDDPSLRQAAAWLALEDGAPDRAVIHTHAGLARETDPYRRAQLLLWGSRAARAIDPPMARRWADELG